jgi:hypothetical protein
MTPTLRETLRRDLVRSKGVGFIGLFAAMGFFFVAYRIGSQF